MDRDNLFLFQRDAFPCPKCGEPMKIRTSRQVTNVVREQYWFCTSVVCDGKFKANVEIVAQLNTGAYDAGLNIPLSLRKQALAPVPPPDPNQLLLPGLEPPDMSCYGKPPPTAA